MKPMELHYGWMIDLCDQQGLNPLQIYTQLLDSSRSYIYGRYQFGQRQRKPDQSQEDYEKSFDDEIANMECFVGTGTISKLLGISERTLRDWCDNHRVTYYQPNPTGGNLLFKISEIKADMEKMRIQSKWR
ncbi:MAG: helix-turn-helix domain-containing protein [Opitutaceae bacterium]|jgi:hypothetical protein|nr:helix-turn-helix domain-containing protein [Opitutaceae bacterium]